MGWKNVMMPENSSHVFAQRLFFAQRFSLSLSQFCFPPLSRWISPSAMAVRPSASVHRMNGCWWPPTDHEMRCNFKVRCIPNWGIRRLLYSWNVMAFGYVCRWSLVSGNQQAIGSPCQLAVCHWSPSGKTTDEDKRQTRKSAITFQLYYITHCSKDLCFHKGKVHQQDA